LRVDKLGQIKYGVDLINDYFAKIVKAG